LTAPEVHDEDSLDVEQPTNFDQVPTALWLGGSVSSGAVLAYIAIRRIGTMRMGRPIAGRRYIAADLGIGVRTLDGRLDELVQAGWLLITPRIREGGQGRTSNHYTLLWEPIDTPDDPRLVRHTRLVAEVEEFVRRRAAENAAAEGREAHKGPSMRAAAWDPEAPVKRAQALATRAQKHNDRRGIPAQDPARGAGAESCAGPLQDPAPGPAQDPAPLEPNVCEPPNEEPSLFSVGAGAPTAAAAPGRAPDPEADPLSEGRADVEALCAHLADFVERTSDPRRRPRITRRWRRDARLLLDDGVDLEKAKALIDWIAADRFWSANCLSMPTFREKYEQIRRRAIADWEARNGPGGAPSIRQQAYLSDTDTDRPFGMPA
jgi:hypothetical protein